MGERIECSNCCTKLLCDDSEIGILTSIVETAVGVGNGAGTADHLLRELGDLQAILSANVTELQIRTNIPPEVICELQKLKYLLRAILRVRIRDRHLLENLEAVTNYFRTLLIDKRKEQFHVLFLNHNFELLAEECLQIGTVNHVTVYPRELIALATMHSATHLMLVHNHPTGKATPGISDIVMTEELVTACRACGIHIADHIILASEGIFSFRENELLKPY